MKTLTTIAITALMTTVLGFTFYLNSTGNSNPIKPVPAISQIQMLSDLATLKVQLSDSMKGENNRWDVQWLLHGEAILGVDLSKAAYVSVDESSRTATILLPEPHLVSSKVDHDRSMELVAKRKTWVPLPGLKSLRDEAWKHGDPIIAKLALNENYISASKLQAEKVIEDFLLGTGWQIECKWASDEQGSPQPSSAEQLAQN